MIVSPVREFVTDSKIVLVRVGCMGDVYPMRLGKLRQIPTRGTRLLCRTQRGLEMGVALGRSQSRMQWELAQTGEVLRPMGPDDELLLANLGVLGEKAHQSCLLWLAEQNISATLLEVEPLMDGRTLVFHFLSEVTPTIQEHLDELVSIYEAAVAKSPFAELVETGCGPGCGTESAVNGCGSKGGCGTCAVAKACKR